jgi:Xaa-Pro dipeptidase
MPADEDTKVTVHEATATLRRLDVDAKQHLVARLLHDSQCEALLVLHPANFRWLTAGAGAVGLFGRDEAPALFFNPHQRWLLASATDSQRFFDEDLDGLGFQLKEWHWTSGREQLLADLVFGRRIACDQPYRDCRHAGTFFVAERRKLSGWEAARLTELGRIVAHAAEATARHIQPTDTEEEVAGQLAHHVLRHGVEPVALEVTGGDRGLVHRRRGFGSSEVGSRVLLQATGRRFGLHATAARTVTFGPPASGDKNAFDAALRLRVVHLSSSKVGERVADALAAGRRFLRPSAFEHEWRFAAPVSLTGREASEGTFLMGAQDRWFPGWAAVWHERIAGAGLTDTYLLSDEGWTLATPAAEWPIRRVIFQGKTYDVPDVLVR